jgi:hypothetical protein
LIVATPSSCANCLLATDLLLPMSLKFPFPHAFGSFSHANSVTYKYRRLHTDTNPTFRQHIFHLLQSSTKSGNYRIIQLLVPRVIVSAYLTQAFSPQYALIKSHVLKRLPKPGFTFFFSNMRSLSRSREPCKRCNSTSRGRVGYSKLKTKST